MIVGVYGKQQFIPRGQEAKRARDQGPRVPSWIHSQPLEGLTGSHLLKVLPPSPWHHVLGTLNYGG